MYQNAVVGTFINDALIISTTDFTSIQLFLIYPILIFRTFKGFININATT